MERIKREGVLPGPVIVGKVVNDFSKLLNLILAAA